MSKLRLLNAERIMTISLIVESPESGHCVLLKRTQNISLAALLAYILFFIPLLTGAHKTSELVEYHANQGTILFIIAAAWSIVSEIIRRILRFIPIIGWMLATVLSLLILVFLMLCIIGILNAKNGKETPLPVISGHDYQIIQKELKRESRH